MLIGGGILKKIFRNIALYTIAFLILLSPILVLAYNPDQRPYSTTQWLTTKSIYYAPDNDTFNIIDSAELPSDFGGALSDISTSYLFMSSNTFNCGQSGGTQIVCNKYIAVGKESPEKGTIYYRSSTHNGYDNDPITIPDPNNVSPDPLKKITQGWIRGRVFPYPSADDWSSDPETYLTKEEVVLKYEDPVSKAVIDIDDRPILKDAKGYYFEPFTINKLKGGGLYPGRYRLYYRHGEGGDCQTGDASGNTTSDAIIGCETIFYGVVNFDLIYVDGSNPSEHKDSGLVNLVGNETENEAASPANGKETVSMTSPDNGINLDVTEEQQNTFTEALKNATTELLKMINFGITTGSSWIDGILKNGNDIEGSLGVSDVWKQTRNMALGLLTFAIILIAFANILSLDLGNYGLARILPKMIIAIVMTYFSYLIAVFLLDLMSAFQSLLFQAGANSGFSLAASVNEVLKPDAIDNISAISELVFLVILGAGLFIAVIWLCIVLVVRSAMLFVLIAVAPIAFMANILPFTETYYKKWWGEFWKWAFMGPAVAFMLWLSQAFLSGYLAAKYGSANPDTPESWVFLIGAAVLIFMTATLPLKMGGEIMKKATQPVTNSGKSIYKKTGIPAALEQRKGFADARAKARGQAMLGALGAGKTTGLGGFMGRRLSGTSKEQQQALRMQTLKGLGESLPEDAAALQSIIESTRGLRQEAAVLKAASSGKLATEKKDASGNVIGPAGTVAIVEDLLKKKSIPELDKLIGKEQGDFFASAAAVTGVAEQQGDDAHMFTKNAAAGLKKTPIGDYKPAHWKFIKENQGDEAFNKIAEQKSTIDAALKGKPESADEFAKQMVASGAVHKVLDAAQKQEILARTGAGSQPGPTGGSTGGAAISPGVGPRTQNPGQQQVPGGRRGGFGPQ